MSLHTKSNEEQLLEAITGHLAVLGFQVRCELGEAEDARRGAPPRITWVPAKTGGGYTHPAQQHAGSKTGHEKTVPYQVHVWGGSVAEATRLEEALIAVLYNQLSPNAYELGDRRPAEPPETPNEGKGYELVIGVRLLRIPIAVERRSVKAAEILEATGQVEGHHGAAPVSAAPTITIGA